MLYIIRHSLTTVSNLSNVARQDCAGEKERTDTTHL